MCGKINELEFYAGQVTLNGYKVAGYVPLCNAVKEDSDLDLITLILDLLTNSLGLALDMAILYGTGTKMPMGIVARLAKTTAPEDYPANAPEWKNLSETNLLAVTGKTGAQLFQAIIEATGAIDSDYTNGNMFWAMNAKTHAKVVAQSVSINAAGAVVAGVERTMPVLGGAIEVLNFIPEDVIIGGYGDMYLLAERAGMELAYDTSVHFLEDETVFRGKARYDGTPVIPAAFVAIGINGNKPAANAVTFAEDKANA
jgi:HK97 family phage major capsid protein